MGGRTCTRFGLAWGPAPTALRFLRTSRGPNWSSSATCWTGPRFPLTPRGHRVWSARPGQLVPPGQGLLRHLQNAPPAWAPVFLPL